MFDFKVRFTTYAPYNEIFMRLHYINHFSDSTVHQETTWREYHWYDPEMVEFGQYYAIGIEGIPLFDKIGNVIPDIKGLKNRRFEYAEIIFNCTDENLYRYNESVRIMPSDQAGKPYSNVVNGMGLVGSRYTMSRTFLFDYRSLSELCEGEYTKHLKFVLW